MVKDEINEIIIKMTKEEIICKALIFSIFLLIFLYYLIMIFFQYFLIPLGFYDFCRSWGAKNSFQKWLISYLISFLKANILIFLSTILLEFFSKNKKRILSFISFFYYF